MGGGYLRYPGREKSDRFLWSVPPYNKPQPTFARTGEDIAPGFRPYVEKDGKTATSEVLDSEQFVEDTRI